MGEANKRGTQPDPKESGDPATNRKGCVMDAREKWMTQLAELCFAFYDTYQSGLSERAAALDAIQAHARTTPEGFALVPVPEWVPVGERLPVVPEGERSCPIWVASTQDVLQDRFHPCDAEWWKSTKHHYTHWSYRYIEPTPKLPKSESL